VYVCVCEEAGACAAAFHLLFLSCALSAGCVVDRTPHHTAVTPRLGHTVGVGGGVLPAPDLQYVRCIVHPSLHSARFMHTHAQATPTHTQRPPNDCHRAMWVLCDYARTGMQWWLRSSSRCTSSSTCSTTHMTNHLLPGTYARAYGTTLCTPPLSSPSHLSTARCACSGRAVCMKAG
jgi:hypothetical protein